MRAAPLALERVVGLAGLVVLAGLAGCPSLGGTDDADDAFTAFELARAPRFFAADIAETCAAVALTAQETSGAATPVTHGTLSLQQDGTFAYADAPADALVLDGDTDVRFEVLALEVDAAEPFQTMFVVDHDVRCRAAREDDDAAYDVEVRSTLSGGGTDGARALAGSLRLAGTEHDVDYSATRTVSTSVDGSLIEYQGDDQGSIALSADDGFSGTIEVSEHDKLVAVENFIENRNTTVDVDVTVHGHRYVVDGGVLLRSFTNGLADESSFWQDTDAAVLQDGAPFGEVRFAIDEDVGMFQLTLEAGGRSLLLEQYLPAQ